VKKKSLFGTSGIRGDAEKLFTNQFCFDIGRSFAQFLKKYKKDNGVAIGMDPRGSSPRIKDAVISGIAFEKSEVYDQGATSVPSICYIMQVSEEYSGSIMVSGSHIKPHLNGIKFFAFKEEILKKHEKEIEKIYFGLKEKRSFKKASNDAVHEESTASDEYKEYLMHCAVKDYPSWKVVVDPGDGAQSDIMPQVLKRLGLNVIEMNATIQGEFYSRDTEVEGDFKDLQKRVVSEKADFGIGYDSDGDRVVFVDEKGKYIPGDYTGTLIARGVVSDTLVTPINTSQVVDKIDKRVVRTKVGSPYVVAEMKKLDVDFGFEANGGGIFKNMRTRDGGRTTIEILNILKKFNKKLSSLVAELPKFYIARDKVEYKWELRQKILNEAKKNFKGTLVQEIDGLKIWLDESTWILFRSSKNAPEFRVFVESKSEQKSHKLLQEGISFVKEVIKKND
jgi:phosphomannomutase/phosphoglucomutase